jgi:hypothetical protein
MPEPDDDDLTPAQMRAEVRKAIREQAREMGSAMTESMSQSMVPMMAATTSVTDEAKAWDSYVSSALRALLPDCTDTFATAALAVQIADRLIAERCTRYGAEQMKARMLRAIDPTPDLVCGKMMGLSDDGGAAICVKDKGHDGECVP